MLTPFSIPYLLSEAAVGLGFVATHGAAHLTLAAALPAIATMGTLGAAAGAVIGIDREYVRRWIDGAESLVVEPHRAAKEAAERKQEVNKITQAAKHDERNAKTISVNQVAPVPAPTLPVPTAPTTHISSVDLQSRMVENDQALQAPAV